MNPKPILAVLAASVFLGLCALVGAPSAESQGKSQIQNQSQSSTTLTPQQIEDIHSRLFFATQSQLDKARKPIPEIPRQLASTSGDIYLRNIVPAVDFLLPDIPARFAGLACDSDLVVLGTTGAGISHMTFDKSFLYTDWELSVERVFKNNPSASVQVGSRITLVAPGGTLQIDGRTIHATEGVPFPAAGQKYLIFLTSVPKTGAYTASDGFLISGATVEARGAFACTIDTRTLDFPALIKLMEGGAAAATHMPNCKGSVTK